MTRPLRTHHRPRHLREAAAAPSAGSAAPAGAAPAESAEAAAAVAERTTTADPAAAAPAAPSTRSRLMRATAVMASGALVSRLLGFVRTFLFGMIFVGAASAVGNAISAATVLPNTIWVLIGGGTLNAILVPAIVRAAKQPDRGSDYTSRLMTLVITVTAALTAVCVVAVPLLLLITNGAMPPESYALAVQVGYWMVPQILFSALYVLFGQLLNAHNSFGPFQWATVINNLVGIIGAVVFLLMWGGVSDPAAWTTPMVIAFAGINVGGSAMQALFLWYFVRKLGLHLRPRWGFRGLGLGKLGRLGLWTMAMLGIAQIGMYAGRWSVGNAVASAEAHKGQRHLAEQFPGWLTLDWAYLAFMIPQGILGVTLVTAAFPSISRSAAEGDHARAMHRYEETARILAVPMMLCTAVFIALSGPIMWVIDGGTSPAGARANGWVLAGYMVGLFPFAANYLTKRAFYAYEDARAPFLMQLPTSAAPLLAVAPILWFVDAHWAAAAAAIASSLGSLLGWLYGQHLLRRRALELGAPLGPRREAVSLQARLLLAAAASLAVGFGALWVLGDLVWASRILAVLCGGVIGVLMTAVFGGVAWTLGVGEVRTLAHQVLRRVRRRSGGGGGGAASAGPTAASTTAP